MTPCRLVLGYENGEWAEGYLKDRRTEVRRCRRRRGYYELQIHTAMTSNSKDRSAQPADMTPATAVAGPSRHEQVLDEAARQLNQKGVLLTSLAEIAAKLGVTRGAMYHYVADREDLVFQCYRRAAEITARHLLEAGRADGTAADVLRVFVTRMLDPNEPEIAARAEIAMLNPTQRDTIQGLYDAL